MKISPVPPNEAMRLLALKELNILDTASEQDFDDITRLATQICKTPISLITLLDENRQWFKSKQGLSITETGKDISICAHAIHHPGLMIVPDALKDDRFMDNPLVTGAPFIRFYAGIPIRSVDGFVLGTLCIMDDAPRSLTSQQVFGLEVLARQVQILLQLRKKNIPVHTAEEKFRNILTDMNLGLLEVDTEEKIRFANQCFCDMSGYEYAELKGRKPNDIFIMPDNRELMKGKTRDRKEGALPAYEIAIRNKRGQIRWWLISDAACFNDAGIPDGSIGIHLDITKQKRLEIDLPEARAQAAASTRSKEAFLANMSHEIRTPMNAIVGMSDQLAKTTLSGTQQVYLNAIHTASENLLFIISDILDLSKIKAGTLQLERIGFDPGQMMNRAIRVVSHQAEEKGLTITNERPDATLAPVLMGDPFRITQVMLSLLNNAIKFTEKGGIGISCEVLKDAIQMQTIRVVVKDTGIGMEEQFIKNLFEKFSQEDVSVTRQYGGTGLGMSICSGLVELMGGQIKVESKKGAGTIISFVIPFEKGSLQNLPPKQTSPFDANMLSNTKILVVDDNQMNRLVAATILRNFGAITSEAVNGQEAIDALADLDIDLVLMDIQMPVMDGMEATGIIRERISKSLPVIALTANAAKGDSDRYIAGGMNGYISKPFQEKELMDIVAFWINKNKSRALKEGSNHYAPSASLYDLSGIQALSRGNTVFVEKMVNMFVAQTPSQVLEMEENYQQGDYKAMGAIAHKLKPVIDSMGIVSLKEPIREVEKKGKLGMNDDALPHLLEMIISTFSLAVDSLRKEFPV